MGVDFCVCVNENLFLLLGLWLAPHKGGRHLCGSRPGMKKNIS